MLHDMHEDIYEDPKKTSEPDTAASQTPQHKANNTETGTDNHITHQECLENSGFSEQAYLNITNHFLNMSIKRSESMDAIYVYGEPISNDKVQSENAFIQFAPGVVLIIKRISLSGKEITEGCTYTLNYLNCHKYFLTHQIDIQQSVYMCRCIVPQERLESKAEFEGTMKFVENESKKALVMLSMEED
jgi:hypothetical protein